MASAVLIILYKREHRVESDHKFHFSGIIYDIRKTTRQHDDVYVTDGHKCVLVKDLLRRDKGYEINIGDSLIKPIESDCFFYKKGDSPIIRLCNLGYGIYFSDFNIPCR